MSALIDIPQLGLVGFMISCMLSFGDCTTRSSVLEICPSNVLTTLEMAEKERGDIGESLVTPHVEKYGGNDS